MSNGMITTLREAVGQSKSSESYDDQEYFTDKPDWFFSEGNVIIESH